MGLYHVFSLSSGMFSPMRRRAIELLFRIPKFSFSRCLAQAALASEIWFVRSINAFASNFKTKFI